MLEYLHIDEKRLKLVREAYRKACIENGIDPSEQELNLRIEIVQRIIDALESGEDDDRALSALCLGGLSRSRLNLC